MDDKNEHTASPQPLSALPQEPRPAPRPVDLDDLIFRGQGWLISDR